MIFMRVPALLLVVALLGCVGPTSSLEADRRIADLEKQTAVLRERVDTLTRALIEYTGDKFTHQPFCGPEIEAKVLDVKHDLGLVILDKGLRNGVRVGYIFDIYLGSTYKGQVRVQDVGEGMSSGLILNEKNPIARGDSATTFL